MPETPTASPTLCLRVDTCVQARWAGPPGQAHAGDRPRAAISRIGDGVGGALVRLPKASYSDPYRLCRPEQGFDAGEIEILHAQTATFHQAQAAAV